MDNFRGGLLYFCRSCSVWDEEDRSGVVVAERNHIFGYVSTYEVAFWRFLEFRAHFYKAQTVLFKFGRQMYTVAQAFLYSLLVLFLDSLLFFSLLQSVVGRHIVYSVEWAVTISCICVRDVGVILVFNKNNFD